MGHGESRDNREGTKSFRNEYQNILDVVQYWTVDVGLQPGDGDLTRG